MLQTKYLCAKNMIIIDKEKSMIDEMIAMQRWKHVSDYYQTYINESTIEIK